MPRSSLILLLPLTLALRGEEVQAQDQEATIQLALDLPIAARDLRRAGVPDPEVKIALKSSREKGLGAHEADVFVRGAERDVKERGPVDNFGAFVQAKLDEGLRGRELAAAIHAEHEARGKGKGHDKQHEPDHGHDDDHGKGHDKHDAPDHGHGDDHGKGHDKDHDHGKPEDRGGKPPEVGGGKPEDRGGKANGGGGKGPGGAKAQSGGSRR